MDREKVIDTIQKLLRLADGTTSQAEAESASAKVQELLFKYKLEMEDVHSFSSKEDISYNREFFDPLQQKNESTWVPSLYGVVAKYNFCHVVMHPQYNYEKGFTAYRIAVVGQKNDVEIVNYLCEWLIPHARKMAKEAFRNSSGYEKKGTFTRGFLSGFVTGIGNKLYDEWTRLQHQSESSTALVVSNKEQLDKAVRQYYPHLSKGRASTIRSTEGYTAGVYEGRNTEFRKGIETRSSKQLKGG